MSAPESVLKVSDVSISFEALQAVRNASFDVPRNSVTGLLGPNGAGKTTMFNLISGVLSATSGEILFEDRPIHRMPSHLRARAGIARTFQDPRMFYEVSVRDQILAGFSLRAENPVRALLRDRQTRREWQDALAQTDKLLRQFGLYERADEPAQVLSFGEQRFLSVARALAGNPRLVLLDEPSVGLDERAVARLSTIIRRMAEEEGRTVLLVEHNMKLVFQVCDYLHLMVQGTVVASGSAREMRSNSEVIEAYLGARHAAQRN